MKNLLKITFLFVLIFLLPVNFVYAEDTVELEQQLGELGIDKEYTDNIAEYINNIDITDDEYNSMVEEGEAVLTAVDGKNSITDFSLSELYNVYGSIKSIMKMLNLSVKIDIINRQFAVVDKGSDNILYKGNPQQIEQYYSNYEELLDGGKEALNLEVYIKNFINSDDAIMVSSEVEDYNWSDESTEKPKLQVKESETDNYIEANYEPNTSREVKVDESTLPEGVEEEKDTTVKNIDKNPDGYIENFEDSQEMYNNTLISREADEEEVVYYILGGAMLVLIITSGVLKFL